MRKLNFIFLAYRSAIIPMLGVLWVVFSILWIQHRKCSVEHPLIGPFTASHSATRTATTDDIAQLRQLITETTSRGKADKYADMIMPGFSAIMLLRLYAKQVNLKGYLFDVGGQNENRLST